ncbi:hypothetical protein EYF80_006520 [Liparis tanakae]|uniref:Uncharacterized protein n=1 Tax=Liparis tanakae TaxID=230148 RepID=A0A4Z2IZK5_9TELE|nr:hypothetical protein EYF80_006520 [Liparis tanakae]
MDTWKYRVPFSNHCCFQCTWEISSPVPDISAENKEGGKKDNKSAMTSFIDNVHTQANSYCAQSQQQLLGRRTDHLLQKTNHIFRDTASKPPSMKEKLSPVVPRPGVFEAKLNRLPSGFFTTDCDQSSAAPGLYLASFPMTLPPSLCLLPQAPGLLGPLSFAMPPASVALLMHCHPPEELRQTSQVREPGADSTNVFIRHRVHQNHTLVQNYLSNKNN